MALFAANVQRWFGATYDFSLTHTGNSFYPGKVRGGPPLQEGFLKRSASIFPNES